MTVNYRDSDISRLLTSFTEGEPDRVPYFEYFSINADVYERVLGRRPGQGPIPIEDEIELALRLGMDAVRAERFGWFPGNRSAKASDGTGHYAGGWIRSRRDLDGQEPPPIEPGLASMDERMAKVAGTPLGTFLYIPSFFPSAHVSMGLEAFSYALVDDRPFIEHFMDRALDFLLTAVREALKRPVDFMFVDCDCAFKNGLMINPTVFRELWFERTRRLIEPAQEKGIPVTFHSDGKLDELLPMLVELGINAVHPIEPAANDIYAVKERWGKEICVMGNIDVAGALAFGSPDEVRADAREHIRRLGPGGHYVLGSSSHPFPGIPADNVLAMARAVHGD